ncbi:MAG: zinc metalloprotease HtpX [Pirellulaceae bacterium]
MPTAFVYKSSWKNLFQGVAIVATMFLIVMLVGWLLLDRFGIYLAIGFLIYSVVTFRGLPTAWVMRQFRAQAITMYEAPQLVQLFEELTRKAGIRNVVSLYYLPTSTPNAFATGHGSDAAVCVSDGILRLMNRRELMGVLAHELSHIRNQDTRIMGLAQTMGRVTAFFSRIGVLTLLFALPAISLGLSSLGIVLSGALLVVAPLINTLLQLGLSRSREFNADLGSADITGDPMGLASALQKLENTMRGSWLGRQVDPRSTVQEPNWLRTHPATGERITRLKQIAASMGQEFEQFNDGDLDMTFHAPVEKPRRYRVLRVIGDSRQYTPNVVARHRCAL